MHYGKSSDSTVCSLFAFGMLVHFVLSLEAHVADSAAKVMLSINIGRHFKRLLSSQMERDFLCTALLNGAQMALGEQHW